MILAGGSFLLLMTILSMHNRFAVDDYYHINIEKQFGIWGGMIEGYNNWGGRWTSYLLWNIIFHFHENYLILALFSFATVMFFIFSIFRLFNCVAAIKEFKVSKFQMFWYSVAFAAFFFQISFGKGEIWFWVVSTCMYITSMSAFIMGMSLLISKKTTTGAFFIMIVCFGFAGGASEIYATFYLIFLAGLIIIFFTNKKNNFIEKLRNNASWKIYISFAVLTIALIISFLAPGNSIRETWLPDPSISRAFLVTLKSLGKILLFKIPNQIPWIILFSIPYMYIGQLQKKDIAKEKSILLVKKIIISIFILLPVLYILMFPACYLLSEIGPDRSLSITIICIALFCVHWSFRIGTQLMLSKNIAKGIFYLTSAVITISFGIQCVQQFNVTSKYSNSLDKRIAYLKGLQESGNKKTITVASLPVPGYLYSAEISSDTNYFGNDHFQKGLFLDFKVKIINK